MGAMETSVVEVVADGAIKQQASISAHADAMERDIKSAAPVSHRLTYSLERDIARVWQQYNKSHFRDEIAGIRSGTEFG